MQQAQTVLKLANEKLAVRLHWQLLGSKVRFLVVTLLVLFRHEQFKNETLVILFVWLTQVQFWRVALHTGTWFEKLPGCGCWGWGWGWRGISNWPPMQQEQTVLKLANERFPVWLHMQVLGSKVRFLEVTLLVLLKHEQFKNEVLVRLLVWLTQEQFWAVALHSGTGF